MRSGDEPAHARSPLRLRLTLAAIGFVTSVGGAWWCVGHGLGPVGVAFALVAALALVDGGVIVDRIRRGPHWQPGRDVPPYRPPEPTPPPAPVEERVPPSPEVLEAERDADQRRRLRRYLWVMGTCLLLITNAWTWVRLVAPGVAIAMTLVAMVLPPIAAMLASPLRRR
ncbi:MAG: DUF6343 family protein [Kineosporiaceae bacterium]